MLTIHSFADGVGEITDVLKAHGRLTAASLANAKKVFRRYLGTERTMQKAIEDTIAQIERDCAAIAKSETDSSDVYSNDFNYPPTPGQRADAATRALQVQGLAQAATRQLQAMGINDPTESDVERAIAGVLNASITNFEGENGITVDNSNPAVAARLREVGDSSIWIDMSSPYQLERPPTDVEAVISNFEGTRNGFYLAPPRSEMGDTSFSGSTGSTPPTASPGTTAEPSTVPTASVQAIAQAAYAAGVAAGASNFEKRKR